MAAFVREIESEKLTIRGVEISMRGLSAKETDRIRGLFETPFIEGNDSAVARRQLEQKIAENERKVLLAELAAGMDWKTADGRSYSDAREQDNTKCVGYLLAAGAELAATFTILELLRLKRAADKAEGAELKEEQVRGNSSAPSAPANTTTPNPSPSTSP